MHRTVATLRRPEPHVFVPVENAEGEADFGGVQTCARCSLPKSNALHIPAEEFYEPTPEPAREIDDRRMGEAE